MIHRHGIGIFDSGVGGLTVWRHVREQMPKVPLFYVADQAHVPYGRRSAAEITRFSERITRFLIAQGAAVVVVACNTATAAAVDYLRRTFPDTPIVGMEPAVKPAAAATQNGKIGVLATAGTFQSQRYSALLSRFARELVVLENPCPGLVEQIERGASGADKTRQLLQQFLTPMVDEGIDTLILGCTHYPFARPLIEEIAGPAVQIIDPAPAVARQAVRVYPYPDALLGDPSSLFWTTAASGRPVLEELAREIGVPSAVRVQLVNEKTPHL
ncbi:MAG: glutamate racemase [Ardenticatenaceae bacterium]|nr:glutamate racemase [Ardenticatenaceae bacterium]